MAKATKYCVIHQADGTDVHGPFDSEEDAVSVAEALIKEMEESDEPWAFERVANENIWQDESLENEISVVKMVPPPKWL